MDIKFDFQNIQINKSDISSEMTRLKPYLDNLCLIRSGGYNAPESFLNLPFDDEMLLKSKKMAEEKKGDDLKYIVVIGIGGSNLGAKAVYEAVFGKLHIAKAVFPKMFFLDTNDSKLFSDIKDILNSIESKKNFLINVISKSGTTVETMANFEVLHSFLKNRFGEIKDRVVVTTDQDSRFKKSAEEQGFSVLEIPQKTGGRFSVFSAVGIFPLILVGVDIDKLLQGAKIAVELSLEYDTEKNSALISATAMYLHYTREIKISNSFFFNSNLESIGFWHRQLLAESLGKKEDKNGNIANVGITPIVSIGSTDLHSMAQLFLGGPKDKFTVFISAVSEDAPIVSEKLVFEELVENIKGKSFSQIMTAIYEGVKKSYIDEELPFMEIILPKVDEYSIGYFMQFKMMEVIFLAELLNVDAFDQPGVENYKKETGRLLKI